MPITTDANAYTSIYTKIRRNGKVYKTLAGVATAFLVKGCVNDGLKNRNNVVEDKREVPTYYWDKNSTLSQNILDNTKTTWDIVKNTADKASEHTGACIAGLILGLGGAGINGIKKKYLQALQQEDLVAIEENNKMPRKNNKVKRHFEKYIKAMPEDVKAKLTQEEVSLLDNCSERFAFAGNDKALKDLITIIKEKCNDDTQAEAVTYKLLAKLAKEHKKNNYSAPINLDWMPNCLKRIQQSPYFIDIISQRPISMSTYTERCIIHILASINYDEQGRYLFNELIEGRSKDIIGDTNKALEVFEKEQQTIPYTLANVTGLHTYKLADVEKIVKYLSQLPDDLKYKMIVKDKVFGDKKFAALLLNEVLPEKSQQITKKFKEQALQRLNDFKSILSNIPQGMGCTISTKQQKCAYYETTPDLTDTLKELETTINEKSDYITSIEIYDPSHSFDKECNTLNDTSKQIEDKLNSSQNHWQIKYNADQVACEMGADYPYHTGDNIVIVPKYDMTLFNDLGYKEPEYKCKDSAW